ncbi:MAG: hypothetical protein A2010_07560 [Nitrospirae bacterium GWD2_57_9]|nr:MAG: hypothetical protein A2010_07560 [Nitrospirae bacterium GWD2_57_9]OGW45941.1 MAG: hypothetical protein A2078_16190 [Nitrospirae bacterium GWC2_57_9]
MRKRNYIKTDRSSLSARRKKLLIAGAALFGVYLAAAFVFGEMGLVKYYRMRSQYRQLNQDILSMKQDNEKLLKEVQSLRSDPDCIERLARDKLGLARPGEIVYYYKGK